MKSATLPCFWDKYKFLDKQVRQSARKAYQLWRENPFHPSLHFKCINNDENIWSVRITRNYRAIGVLEGDTVTWFWIGNHDDYESFFFITRSLFYLPLIIKIHILNNPSLKQKHKLEH